MVISGPAPKPKIKVEKSHRVRDHLLRHIQSRQCRPGDRLPSFGELQEQFQASTGTVSRALLDLERDGVIERHPGRGIFVAERETVGTGLIGVTALDPQQSPYSARLLKGILSVADAEHYEIVLLRRTGAQAVQVDGILEHGMPNGEIKQRYAPPMPCVRMIEGDRELVSVIADDPGGMREATRHLIDLGHRRIACLMNLDHELVKSRLAGYRTALWETGISPPPEWLGDMPSAEGRTFREVARVGMENWLASGWRDLGCTALLAQNDQAAMGVLDALVAAGISVPGELSLIGFDSTPESENCTPRLTSVEVPLEKIGALAMQMLLNQIRGAGSEACKIVLPVGLQVRDSTAPPPET